MPKVAYYSEYPLKKPTHLRAARDFTISLLTTSLIKDLGLDEARLLLPELATPVP